MAGKRKEGHQRTGPSTQPVDRGLEGAIFEEPDDAERRDTEDDLGKLDAAATGKRKNAPSRSSPEASDVPPDSRELDGGSGGVERA